MQGLRVAVTGATGFIGRALCERLGDRRTWVALGRTNPSKYSLPVEFRSVDLSDEASTRAAIPDGTDVLVHLASYRGAENDVTGHFRATTAGTLYLCDAARRAGVRRIVLASTTSVYEPLQDAQALIPETARRVRRRPLTYGMTKKWAEDAARLQALLAEPDIELWTLRIGLVVGAGLRDGSYLKSTMQRLRAGEEYPLVGERGHHLGLVALDDVVDALAVAVGGHMPEGTEAPGPIWNVVGEDWWEADVVRTLGEAAGVEPKFVKPPVSDPWGWTEAPLSVAADGALWQRELSVNPRPVEPLLRAVARES